MIKSPLAIALLSGILFALASTSAALAAPTWGSTSQVTTTGATTSQAPQFLSGTDGSITAITVETVNSTYEVLARRSVDGGSTWGSAATLSAPGITSSDVSVLKLNNGNFAVAWAEASGTSGVNQIRLRDSSDNGQNWTTARTIFTSGNAAMASNMPHLAAFGASDLVLGFQQNDGANDIATVLHSANNLQAWSQPESLSATGSNAKFVTPVVNSNGDIVVSWVLVASNSTKQVQIASSPNWATMTTLSTYAVGGPAKVPAVVALPNGNFVVLWIDPTSSINPNFQVTAKTSSDGGRTWVSPVALSGQAFPGSVSALVTADGGITAAWSMGTGGYTYIESSRSSATTTPSPSSSSSSSPSPSSSSSPSGIGSAWETPQTISPATTGQHYYNPRLALGADGTVSLMVTQLVNSTYAAGNSISSDNGGSWPQGIESISSWYSNPDSLSDNSLCALTSQGFIFGWQTLSNNNPNQGFARTYGWVSESQPSTNPQSNLPATGTSLLATAVLGACIMGTGITVWAIASRPSRKRKQLTTLP